MDRPTHSKARLRIAIVAALLATPAALPPAALGSAPATEEYVLEIPGVRQTDNVAIEVGDDADSSPAVGQDGVVGEGEPPTSPLESAVAMAGSAPAPLLIGLAALLVAAAAVALSRRTGSSSRR